MRQTVCQLLLPVKDKVLTLTSDHGREFAEHALIAKTLQLDFYFAHPYTAWERGTNANTNGLLRQYFLKKSNLQTLSKKKIGHAGARLNFRSHKTLRFKTPFELFYHTTIALKAKRQ